MSSRKASFSQNADKLCTTHVPASSNLNTPLLESSHHRIFAWRRSHPPETTELSNGSTSRHLGPDTLDQRRSPGMQTLSGENLSVVSAILPTPASVFGGRFHRRLEMQSGLALVGRMR